MPTYDLPGVYVEELPVTPGHIRQAGTGVPAFVGYTATANDNGRNITGIAVKITSMGEFINLFGEGPSLTISLQPAPPQDADISYSTYHLQLVAPSPHFRLFQSVNYFFMNGGNACYVVSIGAFSENIVALSSFSDALATLENEPEPDLLVMPDAVELSASENYQLTRMALEHCADKGLYRFCILDIYDGEKPINHCINDFRANVNNTRVGAYGAAYYPWLNGILYHSDKTDFTVYDSVGRKLLAEAIGTEVRKKRSEELQSALSLLSPPSGMKRYRSARKSFTPRLSESDADRVLRSVSSVYRMAIQEAVRLLNVIPPSGAISGLIAMTDSHRGVWKAPGNISIAGVLNPCVAISSSQQEELNSDADGKSVNAIREFAGHGTLVWGARTLLSTDNEWRYISAKRTCLMLEKSITASIKPYVFTQNDSQLWTSLKSMVFGYLYEVWRAGGLSGQQPEEAFFVHCGLGESMTTTDIDNKKLIVSFGVALIRPVEFTIIKIEQRMQT